MPFIGNTPQTQSFAPAVDYFSGNGVTVTFTLSRPVVSVAQLTVAVDNVIQNPSSAFTVSGNSITFTSAPLSGTNNIWVEYTSLITTYAAISQDPSVIGDITATGGFLAEGDFGNSYIDGTIVDYVTGNARITTGPIDDMTFYHGGTSGRSEMMRLSYAGNSYIVGNFGVGTTSPSVPLAVYKASDSAINIQNSTSGVTNVDGLQLLLSGANGYMWNYENGANIFGTNNTERMRIDSSGNVGIGLSSPAGRLHIVSSAGTANTLLMTGSGTAAVYSQYGNTANNFYVGRDNSSGSIFSGPAYASVLYSEGAYPMVFWTNSTERMRIDSAGRVTTPFQPSVWLTNQSNISGTGVITNWTVSLNIGNHYNSGTGAFTCPVAGVYFVAGMIWRNTGTVDYAIRRNGTQEVRIRQSTTNDCGYSGTALLNCAAGDTIDFQITQNDANNLYGSTGYSKTLTSAVIRLLG